MNFSQTFKRFLILLGLAATPVAATHLHAQQGNQAQAAASDLVPFPNGVAPETLTAAQIGDTVTVNGVIREARASTASNIPTQLTLTQPDHTPPFVIVYWEAVAPHIEGEKGVPQAGTRVSVTGELGEHRGSLQVRIRHSNQIRIDGYGHGTGDDGAEPDPPKMDEDGYYSMAQLPALKAHLMDNWVSLKATIREFRDPANERAPSVVVIEGNGQHLDVIYWARRDTEEVPRFDYPGRQVYVTGILGEYRGRYQLQIEEVENLSFEPLPEKRLAKGKQARSTINTPASEGWPGGRAVSPLPQKELEPGTEIPLNKVNPGHVGNNITVKGNSGRVFTRDGKNFVTLQTGVTTLFAQLPDEFNELLPEGTPLTLRGDLKMDEMRVKPYLEIKSLGDITRGR
ncbi:MAG: hypothetical protein JJU11_05610 [Candidatus Sumerlaeia bacterium]|nr:hypothetical protein [Candidatus Sumerlaeia bacterium]